MFEAEREKNSQALTLAAEREEKVRVLQDEISNLRATLAVAQVEAAENEELDSLNARTVTLVTDVKELKEAQTNFKFAREQPNDGEVIDMTAFLPSPGRSVN